MRIVLLGPPGSGKGTQAKRVASHYQIPHVTTASALADIAREESELGRLVREAIEVNRVSDDLLAAVLRLRLSQPDAGNGFVLDGFPRTLPQAETLEAVLDGIGRPADVVILIDVDPDELMERLVGRLSCEGCGTIYNAYSNPPTVDGVCDRCGGRVSRRPDDYEETIGNRLRIYESQTAQLIQRFKLRGKLRRVSGEGEPEKVFSDIRHIIDSTPRTVIEMEPVAERAEPISALPSGLPLAAMRKKAKGAAKPVRPIAPAAKGPAKPATPKAEARPGPAVTPPAKQTAAAGMPGGAKAKTTEKGPAPVKAASKALPEKKAAEQKPAAKPAPKQAPAKPAAAKKSVTKAAPKKATAKQPEAKVVPKKAAAQKPVAKAAPKKVAAKKPVAKKPVAKVAPKKAPAKKPPAKAAPKKPVPKGAQKKGAAKKPSAKPAPQKTAAKKPAPKAAPKKAAAKSATKKPAGKKAAKPKRR